MATARFVLKGENQLKGTLNDAKKDLGGFQLSIENAGAAIAKAFTVTAVVAGLKKLGQELVEVTKEGSEFKSAVGNLQTALGVTDQEMRDFTKNLGKLDDQTKANRLDLIGYAQSFKAFDLSTQQVEKLLQASINLSNVTGKDLSSAITAVQRSLTGSTTSLERMGVEVGNLTEAQLKNGEIADLLIEKYGELSDAMQIGDTEQLLNNISDTLTRVRQNLGEALIDAISPALETLYGWLLKIEEWTENQTLTSRVSSSLRSGATPKELTETYGQEVLAALYKDYTENNRKGLTTSEVATLKLASTLDFGNSSTKATYSTGSTKSSPTLNYGLGWTALSADAQRVNQLLADYQYEQTYNQLYGWAVNDRTTNRFGTNFNTVTSDPFGRSALDFGNGTNIRLPQNVGIDSFSFYMNEMGSGIKETITGLTTFTEILNPLNTIFSAFTEELGSLVNQLLQPLSDVLEWIGTSLADTFVPIFKALMPAVQAVVTIIKSVLTPVLDGLTWVFEQVAAGLLLITGTIQWAADWIKYGIGKITFWTDSDNTSKPGSWASYALDGGYTGNSIVGSASTQTAVASASYTGGNNVTINIYQSGAVVGDSGMRQFAQMIKNEFDELNYYGVA